jgi:tripartite-type tricarboxylate transporter receptor subunit TctC
MRKAISSVILLCLIFPLGYWPALAADEFYKGKKIDVIIGYSAGGTYDATARLLSRHMPKYIPGSPTMVPQNMPGSGSIKAILNLYAVAPKDGTALGMITRSYAIEPIFFPGKAKYDPKKFNPIGSTSTEVSVGVVWHTKPFKTLDDLHKREIVIGATGPTDDTGRFPMILKHLTGAKIKLVQGYPGGNNVTQAMEAGEVDARFGWSWGSVKSRAKHWLDEKKIRILIQMGLEKAKDLPDVPLMMEFAKSELDKQALELIFAPQAVAWPLIAPPDVPKERIAMLREAFDKTMKDPEFNAEAAKLRIDVEPITGAGMQKIVERISNFDRKVIDRALALSAVK